MASSSSRRLSNYRDDEIPAELYDTSTSRLSDISAPPGTQQPQEGEREREREPFPWRTCGVATLLFVIGLTLLLLAVLHFRHYDRDTELAFLIVGSIAFLPGAYAVYNLVQWYRGVPGFHISQIAHWDELRF